MKASIFSFSISLCFAFLIVCSDGKAQAIRFDFYDQSFVLKKDSSLNIKFTDSLSEKSISAFYTKVSGINYQPIVKDLLEYKETNQLNDWLYYQLVRKAAEQLSPKKENYQRYTLFKWFFLRKSGYDARLALASGRLLFFVYSDDDISDIPFFVNGNKQFICLNYHDFGQLDLNQNALIPIQISDKEAVTPFSYKVTRMPDFKPEDYIQKDLQFNYRQKAYHFEVKLNPNVETLFANYPVVSFESYFNIPLSHETYKSLIPFLKENISKMSQKKGVDYLMRFTRYAFLYEDDDENFGKEKRLSPEQTLFYKYSDCDDRAALFFYLVKEIYNLPMIALLYPTHLTMAVQFKKSVGTPIVYNGNKYSICDPTPQMEDQPIGQVSDLYKNQSYKVVYQYDPK